ncbi:MAG: glycosyltransferase WbuB, partial [bacterium]
DNGVIYVNQPSEVLKKVIELCHSNSKLTEYGARARSFVGKNSWDKITDEFEDILSNAALSS